MSAQRLRRWPNIKTALFQRVVFAEKRLILLDRVTCSASVVRVQFPASTRHSPYAVSMLGQCRRRIMFAGFVRMG